MFIVGISGFFGAICRYAIYINFEMKNGFMLPLNTLLINIIGSFLMSLCISLKHKGMKVNERTKKLIISGFVGSFTTFSTVILEAHKLSGVGYISTALFYLFISVVTGILSVKFGIACANRLNTICDSGGKL